MRDIDLSSVMSCPIPPTEWFGVLIEHIISLQCGFVNRYCKFFCFFIPALLLIAGCFAAPAGDIYNLQCVSWSGMADRKKHENKNQYVLCGTRYAKMIRIPYKLVNGIMLIPVGFYLFAPGGICRVRHCPHHDHIHLEVDSKSRVF